MKQALYIVVGVLILSFLVGCVAAAPAPNAQPAEPAAAGSESQPAPEAADEAVRVGLSMDSLESAFWVANHKAMLEKADEMGVELTVVMAEGDPNKQNQQVENLIAQGVDAIIIAPKDGAAIVASVQKAQQAGIPVVMDNRPVQGDAVTPEMTIVSDNYTMAKQALQWFVDKAREEGKTYKALLLVGNLGDENAVLRKKGHQEIIDANKDVIEVMAEVPTEWKHEVALAGMQNAFQAHPEINLVITPSDFLFPPIKSVLEQIGRWKPIGEEGHVAIVSFDGDENGMQYLKDRYNWVNAAQAADVTGYLAVEWAVKLAKGEKPADPVIQDPGVIANIDNCEEVCPSIWGWSMVK